MNPVTPKPSINNFVNQSYKTGTATAQNVLEKLKTLGSSNSISNMVNPIPISISTSTYSISTIFLAIIRYILALLILGFIIINILANMKILPPNLEKFFKPILIFFDNNVKTNINDNPTVLNTSIDNKVYTANKAAVAAKTANNIKGIPIDTNKLSDQLPSEQPVDKLFKKEETKQSIPQPNETDLSGSSKSSYCYIGNDKGIRSCVKVNEHDKCMSGDIFPTHNMCINPNLRT